MSGAAARGASAVRGAADAPREDVCVHCGREAFVFVAGDWWCADHYLDGFMRAVRERQTIDFLGFRA